VTGVREQLASGIPQAVARIRAHTGLPVAVGFGISTREQVSKVAALADGVVVGSALVNVIRDGLGALAGIGPAMARKVSELSAGTARL
jgi:tryptophan synthase alpha chain